MPEIKAANCNSDFSDPTTKRTKLRHAWEHGRNKTCFQAIYGLVLALLFLKLSKIAVTNNPHSKGQVDLRVKIAKNNLFSWQN